MEGDLRIATKSRRLTRFAISNGYGRLKGTTFRLGHMGDHSVDGFRELLGAMDAVLKEGFA